MIIVFKSATKLELFLIASIDERVFCAFGLLFGVSVCQGDGEIDISVCRD